MRDLLPVVHEAPLQCVRPPPGPDDIRSQLERIVTSAEFPGVGRGAAFLIYVVDEVLAGRAQRIKGYSIAIEVFKREEGFTQDDPVVRIEAGRLRRSLERYYLVAGQDDPVRIDIPKGCYVPTFAWNRPLEDHRAGMEPKLQLSAPDDATDSRWLGRWSVRSTLAILLGIAAFSYGAVSWTPSATFQRAGSTLPEGPTLVIAPFADLGEGSDAKLYALGLSEELLTVLPRFKEIKVFGRETSEARPSSADAQHVGARYLLTGGIRVSGFQVRVTARLLDTGRGMILWSQTYDDDLRLRGLFAIQSDVADKVATAIAQPYGIIFQADTANPPPNDLDAYGCTLRFYTYHAELSAERHAPVRDCLESAVARYPSYATAWAMLSMVYLDEHRFKFNARPRSAPALERSLQAARRAVQLDPDNTRGLQALMTALFFDQQLTESLQVGEQALATNPNDTELMGEYGTRLAMSGQWERGASILRAALSGNPGGAGYYHAILALSAYMQQDYGVATIEIRQADLQKFPLFHLVAAVIYAERGMSDDAARESAKFVETGSQFLVDPVAEIQERFSQPADRIRMIQGLRKAGLRIPADAAAGLSARADVASPR